MPNEELEPTTSGVDCRPIGFVVVLLFSALMIAAAIGVPRSWIGGSCGGGFEYVGGAELPTLECRRWRLLLRLCRNGNAGFTDRESLSCASPRISHGLGCRPRLNAFG